MSDGTHTSHKKLYGLVFLGLAVLTVIELFVAEFDTDWGTKAALVTSLAIIKAFLVAYYFMHLNMETWWMKAVAAIPISAAIYAIVVVLEAVYR